MLLCANLLPDWKNSEIFLWGKQKWDVLRWTLNPLAPSPVCHDVWPYKITALLCFFSLDGKLLVK